MKTLERLLVRRMRLQVAEDLDPLQFAYQKHIEVEDAILYMLHRAYAYLDVPGSYVSLSRLRKKRRLRSFNVCSDIICMFYYTIIESALFYAVVCWGSCTTEKKTVGAWTNW